MHHISSMDESKAKKHLSKPVINFHLPSIHYITRLIKIAFKRDEKERG